MESKNKHSVLLSLILIGMCAYIWFDTSRYPDWLMDARQIASPKTFPRLIATIIGGIGVVELLRSIAGRSWAGDTFFAGLKRRDEGVLNVILIIGLILLYVPMLTYFGYAISTFLFAFLLMLRLHVKPLTALFTAVIAVVIVLLLFNFAFRVSLPAGELSSKYLNWRY
ncbi:MAG: tripartite tricarboxylate transporter TctB family protein [Pyramidobacter sp.]|nr:tripartite tricarboxylate transporter TctB family protein [Pyramidobacter sp.]